MTNPAMQNALPPAVDHMVCDLNGTLADTKRAFLNTRARLIERLAELTNIEKPTILADLRAFLKRNSLNPDIIPNLPSLNAWRNASPLQGCLEMRSEGLSQEAAIFRHDVIQSYRLQTGARDSLTSLRTRGVVLSIWSGSRTPYVIDMVKLLGLDGLIDYAFCPAQQSGVRTSLDGQKLSSTVLIELEEQSQKPSSSTLRQLVRTVSVPEDRTLLVGNSLVSDGLSTIGTDVGFVLVDVPDLTPVEIELADAITGNESKRREKANAMYGPLLSDVRPVLTIGSLVELVQRV